MLGFLQKESIEDALITNNKACYYRISRQDIDDPAIWFSFPMFPAMQGIALPY